MSPPAATKPSPGRRARASSTASDLTIPFRSSRVPGGRKRSRPAIRTVRQGEQAELEVLDDGASIPAPVGFGDGTGLDGLRERLERVGGRLDAGPRAAGGYRVVATVPISGPAAGPT